jgi:hypothetical protein
MIELEDERFRLTIPPEEAICFAMGWSDLQLNQPSDHLRQLVGLLALDTLEYSEQWRAAATFRACLAEKWRELNL